MRDKLKTNKYGKVILELKTLDGKVFNCGVLDYTARNNEIIVPNWMMKHLMIHECSLVNLRTVSLPQCESIIFQPHSESFYKLSNVTLALEQKLCHFIAVTEGQTIPFVDDFTGEEFLLTVTQTEPTSGVCLYAGEGVVLELALSFAPPLDSIDNVVVVEEPDDSYVEIEDDSDEWFEPNDQVLEEKNTTGGLIGVRKEEEKDTTGGMLVGKRTDDVKVETNVKPKEIVVTGKTLGGTTESNSNVVVDGNSVKCERCGTVVPKNRFDMHDVHCKKRFGNK
jgi:hypothetical protein